MINASLNWASLVGIFFFLWGLYAGLLTVPRMLFFLGKRSETIRAKQQSLFYLLQGLGRLISLPMIGLILFLQGWRLDPILQFAQFLLAFGIFFESYLSVKASQNQLSTFIDDFGKFRSQSRPQGHSTNEIEYTSVEEVSPPGTEN